MVPIVMKMVNPSSVLDVGCGTGTWLKIFEECGVKDYLGIDGEYVDLSMLKIPNNRFRPEDLSKPVDLNRKFDLVVSLEVAEHIPESSADVFIETLSKHGNVQLFSAAIPGQGGQHHINEQWPEYWEKKFNDHGFYFHDIIRPIIWNNERIDYWYKQNIFLVNKEKPTQKPFLALSVVHPQLHQRKIEEANAYYESLVQGKQGLWISLKIFLNSIKFKIKELLS